jgi:outer membrane protein OmpA-like peptidoglycan-associated protein
VKSFRESRWCSGMLFQEVDDLISLEALKEHGPLFIVHALKAVFYAFNVLLAPVCSFAARFGFYELDHLDEKFFKCLIANHGTHMEIIPRQRLRCKTVPILLIVTVIAFMPACLTKRGNASGTPVPPYYVISAVQYNHNYGDAVKVAVSSDEMVICDRCQKPSRLERVLKPVPISLQVSFSSSPSLTPPAADAALPGKPTDAVPGSVLSERAPISNPTEKVRQQTEVVSTPAVSIVTSTTTTPESAPSVATAPSVTVSKSLNVIVIYFAKNGVIVDSAELKKITDAVDHMKDKSLVVKGFTCDLGPKKANDRLALARSKAVAKILEGYGIRSVMVSGEGKCCYVSDDRQLNRRVEIRITDAAA